MVTPLAFCCVLTPDQMRHKHPKHPDGPKCLSLCKSCACQTGFCNPAELFDEHLCACIYIYIHICTHGLPHALLGTPGPQGPHKSVSETTPGHLDHRPLGHLNSITELKDREACDLCLRLGTRLQPPAAPSRYVRAAFIYRILSTFQISAWQLAHVPRPFHV